MSDSEGGHGSTRVIVVALIVNLCIAVVKFIAAFLSRSSAMLAEACHSLADTTNQIFLLIGMRRSNRPEDQKHNFGYGSESYFWSFMVALSIFGVGGAFSVFEGVHKIQHASDAGEALKNPFWAYVVLGSSIVLELISLRVAYQEFKAIAGDKGVRRAIDESRDPMIITVLFEDIAALFGLAVALIGVFLASYTGNVVWDGAASIVVGAALIGVSWMLARQSRSLLLGRSVTDEEAKRIAEIVKALPFVEQIIHFRTMHLGPGEAILAIKIHFVGNMDVASLEVKINELEAALRKELPVLRRIYVEPGFDERNSAATA